ncbi:MAG: DEDD exonuclease domain-containing protein [Acidimicrobiia bacterium]|nr:DEDD exonuclease domain-containing protein [Acidimicrobiia bacterium]NNF88227.1 DEDD exonuclease domain-containing protein [Acidimicrobiia bacterium]NNL13811.1 DEDD exonuclease domain-containing protein [Acidimicrobiia bacterium]NNL97312.1 DEDD exonuclease domain-containing protein [Acidimicrobiia bacterium]
MTVSQRTFEDMGVHLSDVTFCVLDLETTGGSPADCGITEIGALRFRGGEPDGTFQTLVNPGAPIPPFITVMTGITQAMVIEAPPVEEAIPAFLEFLGDAVIVGHNVRFDISFLNAAAERLGYGRLPNRSSDTLTLARRLCRNEIRNLKLGTLAAHFRSPTTPTHRAFDDAAATAHVFWALLERAGTIGVTHLDDLLALKTARGAPSYQKIGLTDSLPRRPGVYLFKDRTGSVIYVGKAKNLRSRVRSYFYGDERRTIHTMLRELEAIDHRVCANELEAEITEVRLISAHVPRHNRRSKPPKSQHWVKLTSEKFPRLSLARVQKEDGGTYLGPFRSRKASELVMNAIWDAVPIRRCRGAAGKRQARCAFDQLGVSVCPCAGDVDEATYATIVERVRRGIDEDPALLLDPLVDKVTAHAREQRYEEAGWVRDRHRALARAIDRRRSWRVLQEAGMLWAESSSGDGALIERGRLAAAWGGGEQPPLLAPADLEDPAPQTPPTVAVAEEAHLVWRWLETNETRIIDCSAPLSLPVHPVPSLERLDAA